MDTTAPSTSGADAASPAVNGTDSATPGGVSAAKKLKKEKKVGCVLSVSQTQHFPMFGARHVKSCL